MYDDFSRVRLMTGLEIEYVKRLRVSPVGMTHIHISVFSDISSEETIGDICLGPKLREDSAEVVLVHETLHQILERLIGNGIFRRSGLTVHNWLEGIPDYQICRKCQHGPMVGTLTRWECTECGHFSEHRFIPD